MATRILYVITKSSWGGAQRYVYDLATATKKEGYDVAVAYGEEGELALKLATAGVRTIRTSNLQRDMGLFTELRAFFSLIKLFRTERPNVVHLNSSKAGILGVLAARIAGVQKIIFTAHGWAFNEMRPWWQKVIIYKLAWLTVLLSHQTICVSSAVLRDVRWMPFVRRTCIVIHNGIECCEMLSRDVARAELAPHSVGKYWIGMISELHPTKRVDDALRAMKIIAEKHPEAILVVIGEGQERQKLEDLIRELKMRDHVFLAGFKRDAASLLPAFDLFVHAAQSEALAYVLLEAGCASLPVVATRVGGIPEIIPDDDHGLLVPSHNPEALAVAIDSLINNPLLAHELGARLHARVLHDFSLDKMLETTIEIYVLPS